MPMADYKYDLTVAIFRLTEMGSPAFPSFFFLLAFSTLHCLNVVAFTAEASSKLYIVYMGERQHDNPDLVTALHHDMLTSLLGSKQEALSSIVYSYRHGFSGFAAMLTDGQAKQVAEYPGVLTVEPNRIHRLHTSRSWEFLGVNRNLPTGLLRKANYGDGVIVGVVDTGIWPESRSFSSEGYGPIPSRWKGKCQTGKSFGVNNCSRKIIGARWYTGGVDATDLKGDYMSPRDANGHGTHTASTIAGVSVENASFNGLGMGTARGGAPLARLAIYKACWGSGGNCGTAAVLKAIDDAIHDGVHLISLSIGGDGYPSTTIHAVARGISVVFSAGNDGPAPQTVENVLPWVITVAASSIDRSFATVITLGDNQKLVGQSMFTGVKEGKKFYLLESGDSCDEVSLNDTDITGKIVLCYSPSTVISTLPRIDLPQVISRVKQGGGKGLIYAEAHPIDIIEFFEADPDIPQVVVDFEIAKKILDYVINASSFGITPMVKVSPSRNVVGDQVLSPIVGAFSSRGPSQAFPHLLAPDIAAPGVSILAAMGNVYRFDTGTSMACPHVSGIVALLKMLHLTWSPAAIKSALVTTASITDGFGMPIEANGVPRKIADPFNYGGGNVDPNRAADPGLVYDINPKEYFKFYRCNFVQSSPCDLNANDMNLPSISIPGLKKETIMISRTVTNVGNVDAVYKAVLQSPPGVKMDVEPTVLVFNATTTKHTFMVTFTSTRKVQGHYKFGSLTWIDNGVHSVRIPIAVRAVIRDFYADAS